MNSKASSPAPAKGPTAKPSEALKQLLALPACPSVILVIAPDRVRSERLILKILEKFAKRRSDGTRESNLHAPLENANPLSNFELETFAGSNFDNAKLNTLCDGLRSLSLFSNSSFYLLREVDKLNATLVKALHQSIKENGNNSAGNLILCAHALAAGNPLYKFCKDHNTLFELEELKGAELRRWTEKELTTAGIKNFPQSLPDAIMLIGEESPDRILHAINHLSLYVEGDSANEKDLQTLFVEHYNPGEFALIDAISSKNWPLAEQLLGTVLASSLNHFGLLSLLHKTFSNYFSMRALQAKGSGSDDIRQALGMAPWLFNKQWGFAQKHSPRALKQKIAAILKADSKLKNRSLGAEVVFGELVQNLTT